MMEGRQIRLPGFSMKRDVPLWGLSALVAVAAHAAVGLGIVTFAPAQETVGPSPEPLHLELTPLVVSEAEAVDTVETVAALQPEEAVQEETPTAEEEVAETVEEEQPEEVAEIEPEIIEEAQPVVVKKAAVVLPKPVRKKKPVKKVEKPVEAVKKPVKRQVDAGKPNPKAKASSASNSQASRGAPAPSANEFARWKARVNASVARRKPRGIGVSGRVTIVFVVNQSGAVMSSSISRSSGHPKLDAAALSMARGSVPAPPKGSNSSISLTLPVDFR